MGCVGSKAGFFSGQDPREENNNKKNQHIHVSLIFINYLFKQTVFITWQGDITNKKSEALLPWPWTLIITCG